MVSKSIRFPTNDSKLSFFVAEKYSIVYTYHISFACSSDDGPIGCFHHLAIVSCPAVNMSVHVSLKYGDCDSFGKKRYGLANGISRFSLFYE